jgi:hypothetical protein
MTHRRAKAAETELARYLRLLKLDAALFHIGALLEAVGQEDVVLDTKRIRRSVVKELGRLQAAAYEQMGMIAQHELPVRVGPD